MSLLSRCFQRLTESTKESKELKGYKVTDVKRTRKFGIACHNLCEFKEKACSKFGVVEDLAKIRLFLLDGSEIDQDYFSTLEPQTTLVLQKPGEKVLSDADVLYDLLKKVNNEYIATGEKLSAFLTDKLKIKVAVLNNALSKDDSKTLFSTKKDDPEWFEGLETNATTKEAYMHRRCQDRIRGYLYKTIQQIKHCPTFDEDANARQSLLGIICFLRLQLKEDHYFGDYFDRSRAKAEIERRLDSEEVDGSKVKSCYEHCPCRLKSLQIFVIFSIDEVDARKAFRKSSSSSSNEKEKECLYRISPSKTRQRIALCDRKGEFRCGGVWNAVACRYGKRHEINPYRSREELVLFSTWNLDHRLERSRTLVPRIIELCQRREATEKNIVEFYDNLFTVKNLNLVHVICHDKGSHK